jgi:hypothetical protein
MFWLRYLQISGVMLRNLGLAIKYRDKFTYVLNLFSQILLAGIEVEKFLIIIFLLPKVRKLDPLGRMINLLLAYLTRFFNCTIIKH